MLAALKPILTSRTVWSNAVGLLALRFRRSRRSRRVLGDPCRLVDAALQVAAGASFLASTAFRILAIAAACSERKASFMTASGEPASWHRWGAFSAFSLGLP